MAKKKEMKKKNVDSILVDGRFSAEDRKVYEEHFAKSRKAFQPTVDRIRSARRIGKDDTAIRINAKG